MGRINYEPSTAPAHPAAVNYIPKYLHEDPSGTPDVAIRDDFFGTRRKLRIGVLGAGVCAINFLHFAEQQLQDVEIVVFERNEDVGGVVSASIASLARINRKLMSRDLVADEQIPRLPLRYCVDRVSILVADQHLVGNVCPGRGESGVYTDRLQGT